MAAFSPVLRPCYGKVALPNGTYWFDPTISYQRGDLKDISYPDYKTGLVITDTTTALTTIPLREKGEQRVKEIFSIKNMVGKAALKVITEYKGSYADDMRNDFNSNSNYELMNNYKQFYQGYFSGIIGDSLTYNDDTLKGTFTTTEYYTIDSFWNIETKGLKSSFTSYVINGIIKKPKDKTRNMPFYLSYPAKYHEEVEVNLPEDWNLNPYEGEVKCSGFSYKVKCATSTRRALLTYDFENLKDAVTPEDATQYFSKLKEIDNISDYQITTYSNDNAAILGKSSNSTKLLYVIVCTIAVIASIIGWTQRRS